MANIYPNGIGGTTGDELTLASPLYMSGAVWYVDSATGTDAASPAGRNREKPLETLAQAVTNAADNDIIVCLSGHAETLATGQIIDKKLTIVGEGSAAGVPTVSLTWGSTGVMLDFDSAANGSQLRNIRMPPSTEVDAGTRVRCGTTDLLIDGCYIECGANDAIGIDLNAGADRIRLRNTTVISVATLSSAQPGVGVISAGAIADMYLDGLVLSAGTVGFSNYFAFDCSAGAVTRLVGQNLSLLLGADMKLHASSTGRLHIGTATAGSRVEW
jgi:hypothetical protein